MAREADLLRDRVRVRDEGKGGRGVGEVKQTAAESRSSARERTATTCGTPALTKAAAAVWLGSLGSLG